jgi:thiamine kinase-like enzyme
MIFNNELLDGLSDEEILRKQLAQAEAERDALQRELSTAKHACKKQAEHIIRFSQELAESKMMNEKLTQNYTESYEKLKARLETANQWLKESTRINDALRARLEEAEKALRETQDELLSHHPDDAYDVIKDYLTKWGKHE